MNSQQAYDQFNERLKSMRVHEKHKEETGAIEEMLRVLGFLRSDNSFMEALDSFTLTYFGLRRVKPAVVIEHMFFMCQSERVGPFRPEEPCDW